MSEPRYAEPVFGAVHGYGATVCQDCGVLVYNQQRHTEFHQSLPVVSGVAGNPEGSTE